MPFEWSRDKEALRTFYKQNQIIMITKEWQCLVPQTNAGHRYGGGNSFDNSSQIWFPLTGLQYAREHCGTITTNANK